MDCHRKTFTIWIASEFIVKYILDSKPSKPWIETNILYTNLNLMVYFWRESKPVLDGFTVANPSYVVFKHDFSLQCRALSASNPWGYLSYDLGRFQIDFK